MTEENKPVTPTPEIPADADAAPSPFSAQGIKDEEAVIAQEYEDGGKYMDVLETEAEAQGLLNENTAEEIKEAAIDEMEKASQKALDAMREAGNDKNEEVVNEAEQKLDDIYKDFRTWMKENTQPEKIKEEMNHVADQTKKILNDTKKTVVDVANSQQFKDTMAAGKDFITGTGTMIGDGLKYGYDKMMEVPELKKVSDKVSEGVDKLRDSEALKDFVNNAEKGLNDMNNAIFASLHSFFEGSKKEAPAKPADNEDKTAK